MEQEAFMLSYRYITAMEKKKNNNNFNVELEILFQFS